MRKVDCHIHTIPTVSDENFDFDIDKLKEYVEISELDCISITNHNMFNSDQYYEITEYINILVLPGIEINLGSGHLLLISDTKNVSDFQRKCDIVTSRITNKTDSISDEELIEIFGDLTKYILIPHYHKSPVLHKNSFERLGSFFSSGEVSSPKKFLYCIKDRDSLSPSYFSDVRISKNLDKFPTRQTFLDIHDMSFVAIKECLSSKSKVFLTKEEGNDYFQVFDDGLKLSTRLNVILGERSSGKTYTLERISDLYENVKYIKQFSLLVRQEDGSIKNFEELINKNQSLTTQSYLKEFKDVVEDVIDIDLDSDNRTVDNYIESLMNFANETVRRDRFSEVNLYQENEYSLVNTTGLKKLIESVVTIIENTTHKDIILKYIPEESLRSLVLELIGKFNLETESNLKKETINDLIKEIKRSLQVRSSLPPIEGLEPYSLLMNRKKIEKFENISRDLKKSREFFRKDLHKFSIVANSKPFEGAKGLKDLSRSMKSFSKSFEHYDNPYMFLSELKEIDGLEKSEMHKYFVEINYQILNDHGYEVSGGEMSEFNLLQEIHDSQKYDMLLIDEPESSFDNIFLKQEVNELIRDISDKIPVVIVTHNNTVGASIEPNHIIYTQRINDSGKTLYKIFSGHPTDKKLIGIDGEEMSNFDVMINCLEAGDETYRKRGKSYEVLKD